MSQTQRTKTIQRSWGRTESQLIMFSLSSDTIPATKANDTVWMFNKQSRHIMPKSWQLRKTVPLPNPLIRQVAAFRRSRASSHKPFCSSYRFVRQWYQWCHLSYAAESMIIGQACYSILFPSRVVWILPEQVDPCENVHSCKKVTKPLRHKETLITVAPLTNDQ